MPFGDPLAVWPRVGISGSEQKGVGILVAALWLQNEGSGFRLLEGFMWGCWFGGETLDRASPHRLGLYKNSGCDVRWIPHPVIVAISANRDYIRGLLYSYYTIITEWGCPPKGPKVEVWSRPTCSEFKTPRARLARLSIISPASPSQLPGIELQIRTVLRS